MKYPRHSFLLLVGMVAFTSNASFAMGPFDEEKILLKDEVAVEETAARPAIEAIKLESKPVVVSKALEIKAEPIVVRKQAKLKDVVSSIDADEFEKLGLGFSFEDGNLQLTGQLPSACADQLSLDVKKETLSEVDSDARVEKAEDLKEHSSRIGGRLSFHGNEGMKSLSDCLAANEDESKVDLSTKHNVRRLALDDNEIAVAGLLDSSNKVIVNKDSAKSSEYKKLERQLAKLDCKECSADASSLRSRLSELKTMDSPLVASILPKLLEESIKQASGRIESAKKIRDLESIRTDLIEIANMIPGLKISSESKEDRLAEIAEHFGTLMAKNQELAFEAKSATERTRSAEFMASTYEKMAALPGMEDDSKDEALALSKSYKKGGERRLDYLSSIDPTHAEVKDALKKADLTEFKLQREAQAACLGNANQFNFVRCSAAQTKLQEFASKMNPLKQRFVAATSGFSQPSANSGLDQWFNKSAPANTAQTNNLFTLNPAVFPSANAINVNNGAVQNSPTASIYPQATNSNVSVYNSNLPIAIPLSGISNQVAPSAAPAVTTNEFKPSFIVN